MSLPPPESLDEGQSIREIDEIMLRIFLIGFENMTPREFYSTLWIETLWEGCYMKKRNRGAATFMDVSHSLSHSEIRKCLDDLVKYSCVQ